MISVCGSAGKRGMRHYQRQPPHQPCTVARQAWKRLGRLLLHALLTRDNGALPLITRRAVLRERL